VSTAPSAVPSVASDGGSPASGPGTAEATAGGLLLALVDALPPGSRTDHYAASPWTAVAAGHRQLGAQLYLTDSRGTGMVRVWLSTGTLACAPADGCRTDGAGRRTVVDHRPDNCVEDTTATVDHGDGTLVTIQLSTCLGWSGSGNAPGIKALTDDQALALAGDPAFTLTMPGSRLSAAAARFGTLPTFH
ncbi:hypothetical protein ACFW1A_19825, partial [Kitasatospora sp. NPDC058965]|uniref:hypothetical protein n=1 Tax=Kitasatospora sp. NPDC058965 TaxID=3346682 RepID=UPI00369D1C3F